MNCCWAPMDQGESLERMGMVRRLGSIQTGRKLGRKGFTSSLRPWPISPRKVHGKKTREEHGNLLNLSTLEGRPVEELLVVDVDGNAITGIAEPL